MYECDGATHVFTVDWTGRTYNAVVIYGILCAVVLFVFWPGPYRIFNEVNISVIILIGVPIAAFLWAIWIQLRPSVQQSVVLQTGPEGVGSYILHGANIRWNDLSDIKFTAASSARMRFRVGDWFTAIIIFVSLFLLSKTYPNQYRLKIILKLKENSPSWMAVQRKWELWHRNTISIALTLPVEEQIQAALALRATFAYYGGERAARLMRGVRQADMKQTFQLLEQGGTDTSWIDNVSWDVAPWLGGKKLPEIPQHPDFSLPPRDNPDAPPLPRS